MSLVAMSHYSDEEYRPESLVLSDGDTWHLGNLTTQMSQGVHGVKVYSKHNHVATMKF